MKIISKKNGILLIAAGLLTAAGVVFAASYYQVNGGLTVTVNEWSVCKKVTNAAGSSSTFVPTNTAAEWTAFRNYKPSHITLAECCAGNTCSSLGKQCGSGYNDGCGGTLDCGSCPASQYCDSGMCCNNPTPNVTASCSSVPSGGKRVFVTSAAYTSSQITSESVADGKCQSLASGAGLSGTYKAIIWVGSRNPGSILADTTYWNGQGSGTCTWRLVANNKGDFIDSDDCEGSNRLRNPIQYDERGNAVNDTVWTGFSTMGSSNWNTRVTFLSSTTSALTACFNSNGSACSFSRVNNCIVKTCATCEQAVAWYGYSTKKDVKWAFDDTYKPVKAGAGNECNTAFARRLYCAQQ